MANFLPPATAKIRFSPTVVGTPTSSQGELTLLTLERYASDAD
jgi:hypothetical protein